jgi:hypothetical protein
MIEMKDEAELPEFARAQLAAVDSEIAPLRAELERLNEQVRHLATEELRLRLELDTADNEPEPSDFASGAEYGEAKWVWINQADQRAERIIELMGPYAEVRCSLLDLTQGEVASLENSLAALRERRGNIAANAMTGLKFISDLVQSVTPRSPPDPRSEGLLFNAGKIRRHGLIMPDCIGEGPSDMRPDPTAYPRGTKFYDTTLDQIIRVDDDRWRDPSNRVV